MYGTQAPACDFFELGQLLLWGSLPPKVEWFITIITLVLQPPRCSRGRLLKLEMHCFRNGKPGWCAVGLPSLMALTRFRVHISWERGAPDTG